VLLAHYKNLQRLGFTWHTIQHVGQRAALEASHVKVKIWLKKIDTVES